MSSILAVGSSENKGLESGSKKEKLSCRSNVEGMLKIDMAIKALLIIAISFLSLNIFAETKQGSTDTIPFVTYKTRITYYSFPVTTSGCLPQSTISCTPQLTQGSIIADMKSSALGPVVEQEISTSNIPTADVQSLIKRVRDTVCNSVGDSDVRVWVSIDASGKLLGVGASTQSGLEVIFHCKGK